MTAVIVLTTAPDRRAAERLAGLLVRRRLAACVSFASGFVSLYSWKGKIKRQREALLLVKTTEKKFTEVKKAIEENHPYEVPEILGLPVKHGSTAYLQWLNSVLK